MLTLDQKVVKVIRLNEQKESTRVFAANYDVGKIQINSIIKKASELNIKPCHDTLHLFSRFFGICADNSGS